MPKNKAEQFVEWFKAAVELMYRTIDTKDQAVCVFIYARDKTDTSSDPSGSIRYTMMSKMTRYDAEIVRNLVRTELNALDLNLWQWK